MFDINGIKWDLKFVPYNSKELMRSDGSYTYGVTDMNTHCIYISNNICDGFLKKVLCHEIVHAYIISNNIYIPINIEEYICDAIASYGQHAINISNELYKNLSSYENYKCGEQ